MSTPIEVFKFGGASVMNAGAVRNMASIIKNSKKDNLLIVISAMGKITNKLEELTHAYILGQDNTTELHNCTQTPDN